MLLSRQRDINTDRNMDRKAERKTGRLYIEKDRHTGNKTDRWTDIQTDKQIG